MVRNPKIPIVPNKIINLRSLDSKKIGNDKAKETDKILKKLMRL